jgi:two-component system sensor histidine kinase TctE
MIDRLSMRSRLLLGILVPVALIVAFNAVSLYRQAQRSADVAYDRTLLASAKSIGEALDVVVEDGRLRLRATVPYAALEPFEADNRSRIYYRVTGFEGESVSGFEDLPAWKGRLPDKGPYAALVDFYDDRYRDEPVRVAVLLQPVSSPAGLGMATIQVAETLELRATLAQSILIDTLWRQAALVAVIAIVVVIAVERATRPVRELSARLEARKATDLAPIDAPDAPRELRPLVEAINDVIGRLAQVLSQQKRFVRDTSHQLRTPLAVLKTQLQSAQRGDMPAEQALREMDTTVERATELANQMLALAKVEQLRWQDDAAVVDWSAVARAVALDLAPLIAERRLDFSIDAQAAPVRAHEWALRELTRNLLHNAIKLSPDGAPLAMRLHVQGREAELCVADAGPGLDDATREQLFRPFSRAASGGELRRGSGLGLAICHEIVATLNGSIRLDNRAATASMPSGLDAVVRLPLAPADAQNPAP